MSCCGSMGYTHKKGCPELDKSEVLNDILDEDENQEANDMSPAPEDSSTVVEEAEQEMDDKVAEVVADAEAALQADLEDDQEKEAADEVAETVTEQTLDISKLSQDQIIALRDALDLVGDTKQKVKKKNPIVELRMLEDSPIIWFGKAYRKTTFDIDKQKDVVKAHIKVKLLKEDKEIELVYNDFNSLPRIKCEVINIATEEYEVEEGEVFSVEKKVVVPMVKRYEISTLTIKLPTGETVKLPAEYVN